MYVPTPSSQNYYSLLLGLDLPAEQAMEWLPFRLGLVDQCMHLLGGYESIVV